MLGSSKPFDSIYFIYKKSLPIYNIQHLSYGVAEYYVARS